MPPVQSQRTRSPEYKAHIRGKIPGKEPYRNQAADPSNPEAPWGYKKDGTPRKKPGGERPVKRTPKPPAGEMPEGWVNPDPVLPENRLNGNGPICGKPKSKRNQSSGAQGQPCCNPAGLKTAHPGKGPCHLHGGLLPTVKNKHMMDEIRERRVFLGKPIDVDPQVAVIQDIHRTAGHIEYLLDFLRRQEKLYGEDKVLTQQTDNGIEIAAVLKVYQEERKHMVNICKAAVSMGIAERQVQLAEDQGKLIAVVLQAFMGDPDLGLSPAQAVAARNVMKKHLSAIPAMSHLVAPGKLPSERPLPAVVLDAETL